MSWKIRSLAMVVTAATVAAVPAWAQNRPDAGQTPGVILLAACDAGEKIDATTAAQISKKIEAAGYQQVRDLVKGCDNFWHGTAINKDGIAGNVIVTPEGDVKPESN